MGSCTWAAKSSGRLIERRTNPTKASKGFWLSLDYPTAAEAKQVFPLPCSDGGKVAMAIDKTILGHRLRLVVVDLFGVPWMVSCNG